MSEWRASSTCEQFREFLRQELLKGRWTGRMPGVHRLAAEFQLNRKTVEAALRLLEADGLLVARGAGRQRDIDLSSCIDRPGLRVAMLLFEPADNQVSYIVELKHQLQEAGNVVSVARRTQVELKSNVERISRMVLKHQADAWIVVAGSREILEWFQKQRLPTFALFGRHSRLPIAAASPDRQPAIRATLRRLFDLGHRKIVFLGRSMFRFPDPGFDGRVFLGELESRGIRTGPYNIPNWEDNPDGFIRCIDSLFAATPPTALLIDEVMLFVAAQQHLATKGIFAPRDISMVCAEQSPTIDWCRPAITHFRWESKPAVRRIVQWAGQVKLGHDDRRKLLTKLDLIEGGTMGPARQTR